MAKYTNEDQKNLEQLLEEGFWDRLKTRGAEAIGAAKGLGQKVAGAGKALGGAFTGNEDMMKAGVEDVKSSGDTSKNAKIDYLKNNITKRIDKFVANLNNDIQKLGLDIGNIEFASDIQDALEGLKQNLVTSQATPPPLPQQSQATPPPLPQNDMVDDTEDDQVEPEGEVEGGYAAQRQQRSERSKQAAAKRKQQQSKVAPSSKKGKTRNIQKTYDKNFVRENYEKLFWGE